MTHYLKKNIPLQALHTFGVEAFAEYYFDIHTLEDLDTILRNYPEIPKPVLCLGGGSNIIFRQRAKVSYQAVPWVTYTYPELAHVGLLEREAQAQYPNDTLVSEFEYKRNDCY